LSELSIVPKGWKTAEIVSRELTTKFNIRTSGRRTFRRCLRKWGFQSSMRSNLERRGSETNIHFWFGSAIHFAMEDYFGYNRFGDPRRAYRAYYGAFKERPEAADSYYDLGLAMLTYFLEWYPKHNNDLEFETLWLDKDNQQTIAHSEGARPAIEESFTLDLGLKVIVNARTGKLIEKLTIDSERRLIRPKAPLPNEFNVLASAGLLEEEPIRYMHDDENSEIIDVVIVPICYHGTMDRIVIDKYGRWWILDYKTAKGADTNKLDTDDQISSYCWGAEQWYQHKIHGFVYLQLTKDVAKPPRRLKSGDLSVEKKQKTTYQLFRAEVLKDYGEVKKAPSKIIEMLNHLATLDTPEGDRFIRWDLVTRNDAQKIATYHHIMGEVEQMINPNLYLYPNPTRDCMWDCDFRSTCIEMDSGNIDEAINALMLDYQERSDSNESNHDDWKKDIVWPDSPLEAAKLDDAELRPDLFNIILPPEYDEPEGK